MIDKELICIVCPVGCHIRVKGSDNEHLEISGNNCPRGKKYGIKELTDPRRVLPTTVSIDNAIFTRLPVKSSEALPKKLLMKAMDEIRKVRVEAPVRIGDIIIKDILGTGIDIIATRNMDVK